MATSSASHTEEPVPIVLRVKRKRTDDPFEALVISKVRKLESSPELHTDLDSGVFHFAGTASDEDASNEKAILERIATARESSHPQSLHRKHRSIVSNSSGLNNPLARLSLSDRQERRRDAFKESAHNRRFTLVSKLRGCGGEEDKQSDQPPSLTPLDGKSTSSGGTEAAVLMSEMVHLYDVVQEEEASETATTNGQKGPQLDSSGMESSVRNGDEDRVVLCNSTPMVREKLKAVPSRSDGFMYDFYFTNVNSVKDYATFDWSSISVYDQDHKYVHDILEDDESPTYDDEDDSNDEDNWRNDYPDEDEFDSEGEEGDCGHGYRHEDTMLDEYTYNEDGSDPY